MSSTNRSDAREKHVADYYVTPLQPIKDFLYRFLDDERIDNPEVMEWLDPCAGGDEFHPMSYPKVIRQVGVDKENIHTIDIREDSLAEIKTDYLKMKPDYTKVYDVIITNPPFNIAQQIIEKALNEVADGGYVIMLLRLNYFGSKARRQFWEDNMPIRAYIHHKRIGFTDDGKTDSIEYMHCVWEKGKKPLEIKTTIL